MNKIKCFIKAIICCIFPKETKYYKHSKSLVDVEPEYLILSKKDEEFIVPTKQSKELDKELGKIVFSDDLEKYRQVNGCLNKKRQRIFSARINAYLNNKKRGEDNGK